MNTRANIAIATLAGLAIVSIFQASYTGIGAQGKSVTEGIFTAEQATRGEALYKENCAFCHGEDLKGTDVVPGLSDNAFWGFWKDKTVGDLFERIHTSMPATAPGSLTEVQTADIVAHILNAQKFPAGSTELSAKLDDLKPITLAQPATGVGAQGKSVTEGIFTAEQATRGAALYKENCSFCHGEDLKGTDVVPGLSDNAFWGFWKDKSVGDLFERINTSMPATAPGSLTEVQTADIVAHILNAQKFPAGSTELSAKLDDLKPIMLAQPTP